MVEKSRQLEGRMAVVTAAGSGIGRATALRFAQEGAHVVVNDIDPATAEATVAAILGEGGTASAHPGDVSSSSYVDALVADAVDRYGRLDVMHNNAGFGLPGTVADLSDDAFLTIQRVTFHGTMWGTRAALRVMSTQGGGGSIINTASNAAFGANANRATYGAAKAAV